MFSWKGIFWSFEETSQKRCKVYEEMFKLFKMIFQFSMPSFQIFWDSKVKLWWLKILDHRNIYCEKITFKNESGKVNLEQLLSVWTCSAFSADSCKQNWIWNFDPEPSLQNQWDNGRCTADEQFFRAGLSLHSLCQSSRLWDYSKF